MYLRVLKGGRRGKGERERRREGQRIGWRKQRRSGHAKINILVLYMSLP